MCDVRRRQLIIATAATIGAACAPASSGTGSGSTASGRPRDPNAGNPKAGIWPSFLSAAPAAVKQAYVYAADHPEILQYIPCYCGCGSAAHNGGHSDNERCYVVERSADGWMILEPHGSQCGTCVGITLDAKTWLVSGVPLREVRARIDAKWSSSGPPTQTKLPPG